MFIQVCGKGFIQKTDMSKHLRTVHRVKVTLKKDGNENREEVRLWSKKFVIVHCPCRRLQRNVYAKFLVVHTNTPVFEPGSELRQYHKHCIKRRKLREAPFFIEETICYSLGLGTLHCWVVWITGY